MPGYLTSHSKFKCGHYRTMNASSKLNIQVGFEAYSLSLFHSECHHDPIASVYAPPIYTAFLPQKFSALFS